MAFEPELFESNSIIAANFFIDFCFFMDIIVSFRTSFINEKTGAEITDVVAITRQYLKG